jgi:hypothetical protein
MDKTIACAKRYLVNFARLHKVNFRDVQCQIHIQSFMFHDGSHRPIIYNAKGTTALYLLSNANPMHPSSLVLTHGDYKSTVFVHGEKVDVVEQGLVFWENNTQFPRFEDVLNGSLFEVCLKNMSSEQRGAIKDIAGYMPDIVNAPVAFVV